MRREYVSLHMGLKKPPHDRPLKLDRTEEQSLFAATHSASFPKFLIVRSEIESKPLSELSPYMVEKTLEAHIGKQFTAKKLPSGDLLSFLLEPNP